MRNFSRDNNGAFRIVFEGVSKSVRFSLTAGSNLPVSFGEIVIGEPDMDLNIQMPKAGVYTFRPRPQAMRGGMEFDVYYRQNSDKKRIPKYNR
jgi:hypothetical protein